MARSRNIKPGFFTNEILAECDYASRILFAGLWTLADREGRLEDRPRRIKAGLMPYDSVDVDSLLCQLAERDFILRYSVDGCDYIWITGFHCHQRPHHMEEPSKIPPPHGLENRYNHKPITKVQRDRILDRDGRKCVVCGALQKLQIDHIVPVSRGGTSEDDNLRVLCKSCNESKGNREQSDIEPTSNRHRTDIEPCETSVDPLIPDSLLLIPSSASASAEEEPPISPLASNRDGKPKTKRFKPPTVEEVAAYCRERSNGIDPQAFMDSNEAKGWLVGTTKTPMKNWKAAVRTWENQRKQSAPESRVPTDADNARWNPVDGGLGSEFKG